LGPAETSASRDWLKQALGRCMLQTNAAKGLHSSHDTDSSLNVVKPALVCASVPSPRSTVTQLHRHLLLRRSALSCFVLLHPRPLSAKESRSLPPRSLLHCCCLALLLLLASSTASTARRTNCSNSASPPPSLLPLSTPYTRAARLLRALSPRSVSPSAHPRPLPPILWLHACSLSLALIPPTSPLLSPSLLLHRFVSFLLFWAGPWSRLGMTRGHDHSTHVSFFCITRLRLGGVFST
jgi:hypothetical protein